MNCWHCNTELIWGGDQDLTSEENEYEPAEEFDMITNLSCPKCESYVEVYHKFRVGAKYVYHKFNQDIKNKHEKLDKFEKLEKRMSKIREQLDLYERDKSEKFRRSPHNFIME